MSSETLSSSLGGIPNFALLSPNFHYDDPFSPSSYPANFGPPPSSHPHSGVPRIGPRAGVSGVSGVSGGSQCLESQAVDEEGAAELKPGNVPETGGGAKLGSSSSFLQTLWGYKIWLLVTFLIVMGIVFFMYRKYYYLPQNNNNNNNNKGSLGNAQQQQLQQYIQQLQQSLSQQSSSQVSPHSLTPTPAAAEGLGPGPPGGPLGALPGGPRTQQSSNLDTLVGLNLGTGDNNTSPFGQLGTDYTFLGKPTRHELSPGVNAPMNQNYTQKLREIQEQSMNNNNATPTATSTATGGNGGSGTSGNTTQLQQLIQQVQQLQQQLQQHQILLQTQPPGSLPNPLGIAGGTTPAAGGPSPSHAANARFASLQNLSASSSSQQTDSEFFDRFHQMNRDRDLELEKILQGRFTVIESAIKKMQRKHEQAKLRIQILEQSVPPPDYDLFNTGEFSDPFIPPTTNGIPLNGADQNNGPLPAPMPSKAPFPRSSNPPVTSPHQQQQLETNNNNGDWNPEETFETRRNRKRFSSKSGKNISR